MRQFAKIVTLQVLRAYKWAVSPMFPPACRYVPTCSEYAMEAVERCGILQGGLMAFMRLLRCHPFAHGGYDPVVRGSGCDGTAVHQDLKATCMTASLSQRSKRCATQNQGAI
jgi:putative membrane protein insertion efficiency factor